MKDTRKFFVIPTILSFGIGIIFFVYFNFLEHQARQKLPPEMRTPESIQNIYDGAVCLSCETTGTALLFLSFAIGAFIVVLCGVYEVFSKNRTTLK